ncbi:MAG: hypothetical protein ACRYGB_13655 [Janthinobacterium lividum]
MEQFAGKITYSKGFASVELIDLAVIFHQKIPGKNSIYQYNLL